MGKDLKETEEVEANNLNYDYTPTGDENVKSNLDDAQVEMADENYQQYI